MSQTMDAFSLWRRAWLTSVTKTTTMTTSTAPTTTTMPTPTTLTTTTMTSRTAKSRTTTTTTPTTTTLTATKMTARTVTSRTATTTATSTTTPTTFPWNDIFLFHHFLVLEQVLEQERVIIDQAKVDWKCFFCFNRKRAAKGGIAPDVKKSVTTGDRLLDLAPFDWACKHLLQL